MGILAWIMIVVLGLLILLLAAPIRLRLRWNGEQKTFSIHYLVVAFELDFAHQCRRICLMSWVVSAKPWSAPEPHRDDPKGNGSPKRSTPLGKRTPSRSLKKLNLLWRSRSSLRRALLVIVRLAARLVRSWHLERGDIRITAGLGDPARTGVATGCFYSLLPILRNHIPGLHIGWQPCFDRAVWEVEAHIVLRALPGRLVYHGIQAVASWPWRELRRLRANLAGLGR